MSTRAAWKWLFAQSRIYRAQLRFCVRVTVAAISALLIARFFALPLHGLWVVNPREALRPALERIGVAVASYFRTCGIALTSRHMPPPLQPVQDTLTACAAEITASRQTELAQLSPSQLEQLFALGFALEQFQRNIKDLERCIQEWVPTPRQVRSALDKAN